MEGQGTEAQVPETETAGKGRAEEPQIARNTGGGKPKGAVQQPAAIDYEAEPGHGNGTPGIPGAAVKRVGAGGERLAVGDGGADGAEDGKGQHPGPGGRPPETGSEQVGSRGGIDRVESGERGGGRHRFGKQAERGGTGAGTGRENLKRALRPAESDRRGGRPGDEAVPQAGRGHRRGEDAAGGAKAA